MKFKDIATVSGKSGLYKVLKPTRSGVILEAMDDKQSKLVVGGNQRVSVLSEISIYTTTEEGAVPLEEVMQKIEKEFQGDLGLDNTADADELKAFLKHVLPEFDESRVYASDIKKLVSWYGLIRKHVPALEKEQEEEVPSEKEEDKKEEDK
jgi:hypothetical protein